MIALLWALVAFAHPLAPAGLVVDLDHGVETTWRTPTLRPIGVALEPVLPDACTPLGASTITEDVDNAVWVLAQRWDCGPGGLLGRDVRVRGLRDAPVAVIATVRADGVESRTLLRGERDAFTVTLPAHAPAAFPAYLALGVEHLLTGWDHLLLVLGLLLLLGPSRRLLVAVTAFTAGHSVTLALAATDVVRLPQAPVELLIAASLVWLAVEILGDRDAPGWLSRHPGGLSAGIGLIHGLGFAGALAETGLPADALVTGLLGFNLGLEVAQIGVLAVAIGAWRLVPEARRRSLPVAVPGWAIGVVAAAWAWERLVAGLGG